MLKIVTVTPVEFHSPEAGEAPCAILQMTDTDGEVHTLEFQGGSLIELAAAFRHIQSTFPGLLGGH